MKYDEEKKTTSTTLAVSWFHLDGASHLKRGERATERLVVVIQVVLAVTRSHKPVVPTALLATLLKVPS